VLNEAKLDALERNAENGNAQFIDWAMHKLSDQEQLAYARKMQECMDARSVRDGSLPRLTLVTESNERHTVLKEIASDRIVTGQERLQSPQFWLNPIEHKILYRRTSNSL